MRIVQLIESTATGTLAMVQLISNQFAKENHDVHVIYSVRDDTPTNLLEQFESNIKLHHVQMNGRSLYSILKELRSKLSSIQPDTVHLHSSYAGFLGRLASIGILTGTRFFYSPHCISFMRRDISHIKKLCFIALEKLACLKGCMYIACSKSEEYEIKKHIGNSVLLIENAVDDKTLNKMPIFPSRGKGMSYIVTVGGIRKQKNPDLFTELAKSFDSNDVQFMWIGDGDIELKNKLIAAGVIVTGWLSREQVADHLANSTIYLSTALWEGMPVSIIEAMACGLPVVASKCAGNIDVISHERTGLLFSDVTDGSIAIQKLLVDQTLARSLHVNAIADVKTRFSESRFFSELSAAYKC